MLPIASVLKFESEFYSYMDKNFPNIEKEIETKGVLDDAIKTKLNQAITAFKTGFKEAHKI